MPNRDTVIEALQYLISGECTDTQFDYLDEIEAAIAMLKEQPDVVLCKDCENWIPGYITDKDDFIPPKCGKYKQMVGHSAYDYCNLAEREKGM